MRDVTMFCESPECVCEDICCQECSKVKHCKKRCEQVKYKQRIYNSDAFLVSELEELAEKKDNWLIAVAAEKIISHNQNPKSFNFNFSRELKRHRKNKEDLAKEGEC
ncbi:MAG: hypothetical protein FH761_16725 [Firmicutes bacterium]|nr:hypothetical protein [Bacillota bacterium]